MNPRSHADRRAMNGGAQRKQNLLIALIRKLFSKKKKASNSIYPLR